MTRAHARAGRPVFEALEKKEMLSADAPHVVDIVADNRGFVQIVLDADLIAGSVNQNSVRFFDAGDDGLLGTPDDGAVGNVEVSYNFGDRTITADARLVAGTAYGVILDGSLVRGTDGCFLDGEFNGNGTPSGDGVEGGDALFYARATGATIARISTNLGVIDIELFPGDTPITVANFLRYANERLYDRTIIHRSVEGFVIQGGGFEAGLPFLPIPTFDPIQNEPGISNLRGTIAVAKLGGDPNSGTSQWFFNLDDNSGNLDNQNGGFTVFGEVLNEESLMVVDAIGALERFNASATNSAFGEVPVLDLELIEDTSGILMERDVVRIDRVAQLLVVSAEPFGQIDTDEVRTITEDGNAARVTLFSLSGATLGDLSDFVRVSFGNNNAINSITFTSAPPEPIGLQISGATDVGSITERRSGGTLSFIVSSTRVGEIKLKSTISGFALNGVLLADDLLLPEDIDGDNRFNDNTSIFVADGTTRSLTLDNGLMGDVIMPGGLIDLRVKGVTSMADIRTGSNLGGVPMSIRFDAARDVVVETDAPVRSAQADEWSPFLTQNARFEAPSVDRLRIKDDFGADLRVTSPAIEAVGSIVVGGDVLRSEWDIAGGVGAIRFGGAFGWTLDVGGEILTLRGGETGNITVTGNQGVRTFRVDELDGAEIGLASAINFVVAKGDLIGDVTIGIDGGRELRQFRVGGDIIDSTIALTGGANSFKVGGDLSGVSINAQGDFGNLVLKQVTNTDLQTSGDVRQVRAISWEGGSFQASATRAFRTVGNRRTDNPGDLSADLVISNARLVRVAGEVRDADIRLGDNRDFRVGGDLVDSEVRFSRLFFFATNAAFDVRIDGAMLSSTIFADADVETIRVDAMIDSGIYIGTTADQEGFSNIGQIGQTARARGVIVRGDSDLAVSFDDSFIVGGQIDFVRLTDPQFMNGSPFGIAGGQIGRVDVVSDLLTRGFTSPSDGVIIMDDLEIRPGFRAPV